MRAELLAELLTGLRRPEGSQVRAIRLRGAWVSGTLDLDAAQLVCPLLLDHCSLEHPVSLRDARAQAMRLPGCHLPGIAADQLRAEGSVELNDGFTAAAGISLTGARIGGGLDLSSAVITGIDGLAVDADGLTVGLSMFCRDGFTAVGEIRLRTAQIAGQLNLIGAHLANPGGRAMSALGLTVGQDMFCKRPFRAEGEIRMTSARIGGSLEFGGARLDNPGGYALSTRGATIAQDLDLQDGFTARGKIWLVDARVGGRLDLENATLDDPGPVVADLTGTVSTVLFVLPRTPSDGAIDLTNAQTGSFHDDPDTQPPLVMRLRGFAYDKLDNHTADLRGRLDWLKRSGQGYAPGPYDQLAGAYRRAGRAQDARRVAIAREQERRTEQSWPGKVWNWLLYLTVGYGYRNWLAGAWLGALLLLGSAVFASSYPAHMHQAAPVVPAFQPVIYALDVLVPVINFGQQQAWIPQGPALALSWILTAAGWILTTAIAAGLANALKRD